MSTHPLPVEELLGGGGVRLQGRGVLRVVEHLFMVVWRSDDGDYTRWVVVQLFEI